MPEQKKPQGPGGRRHYLRKRLANNKIITEVRASTSWNSLFLAVVAIFLFSGGTALIVVFGTREKQVQDLILIGAILLATSLVFILMFSASVIKMIIRHRNANRKVKPCSDQEISRFEKTILGAPNDNRNTADSDRYLPIPPEDIERERRPSADLLYGFEERRAMSPPPQVALPVDDASGGVIAAVLKTDEDISAQDDNSIKEVKLYKQLNIQTTHSDVSSSANFDISANKSNGEVKQTTRLPSGAQDRNDTITAESRNQLDDVGSRILQKNNLSILDDSVVTKSSGDVGNNTNDTVLTNLYFDVHSDGDVISTDSRNSLSHLGSRSGNAERIDCRSVDDDSIMSGDGGDVQNEGNSTEAHSRSPLNELSAKILQSSTVDVTGNDLRTEGDAMEDGDSITRKSGGTTDDERSDVLGALYSDVQDNGETITTDSKDHLSKLSTKILQNSNVDITQEEDGAVDDDSIVNTTSSKADNNTSADVLTSLYSDVRDKDE